jgi:hypothetical protein
MNELPNRGPKTRPAAARRFFSRVAGGAALAVFAGIALAALDFVLQEIIVMRFFAGSGDYLGPAGLVYGVRGPWQLFAHKAVAYGWLVPALTAAAAVVTAPLYPLYRRLGLPVATVAVSMASALAAAALAAVTSVAFLMYYTAAFRKIAVPIFVFMPVFLTAVAAGVALVLCLPRLRRLANARAAPVAALLMFAAAAVASFWPAGARGPIPRGPNVVLITIDTLRADKVGGTADGVALTPAIDRLARNGVKFTRCVSQAPWTLPSLASLHSGVYPPVHHAGVRAPLAPQFETIAEALAARGYDTAGVCANMMCEPRFGLGQGFRFYRSTEMFKGKLASRLYYTAVPEMFKRRESDLYGTTPPVRENALRYLESRRGKERPFFLWVHFLDPHEPYTPPAEYVTRAAKVYCPSLVVTADTPNKEFVSERLYDGEVRYVDAAVRDLLQELERIGAFEDTAIFITSDHGEEFWEHGGSGHGHTLYDELLVVPLVARVPGVWQGGETIPGQCQVMDLYATILDLCGGKPSAAHQSDDLLRSGGGHSAPLAFSTYAVLGDPKEVAVSDGARKVIISPSREPMCFDLTADAGEHRPMAAGDDYRPLLDAEAKWVEANEKLERLYGARDLPNPAIERQLKALGYVK